MWIDKPRWSNDGKLLYFLSRRGGSFNVWAGRFDPEHGTVIGEPFQVTQFDGSGDYVPPDAGRVEVGIGGRRLALPVVRPTGGIWMLESVKR
jgi:hypothetical protein